MNPSCCRFLVSGRVQGVFFRASTAQVARRLELSGHARNLADGRVEVLACGRPAALAELEAWLWQGSPGSSVSDVSREEVTAAAADRTPWPPVTFTTG